MCYANRCSVFRYTIEKIQPLIYPSNSMGYKTGGPYDPPAV